MWIIDHYSREGTIHRYQHVRWHWNINMQDMVRSHILNQYMQDMVRSHILNQYRQHLKPYKTMNKRLSQKIILYHFVSTGPLRKTTKQKCGKQSKKPSYSEIERPSIWVDLKHILN